MLGINGSVSNPDVNADRPWHPESGRDLESADFGTLPKKQVWQGYLETGFRWYNWSGYPKVGIILRARFEKNPVVSYASGERGEIIEFVPVGS